MKVGTICKLKVDCLGNKAGTLGVVFNDYGDGFQAIFENGCYDGFLWRTSAKSNVLGGKTEEEYYLEEVGFETTLLDYQFKNVMQVTQDYMHGVFSIAWSEGWKKFADGRSSVEPKVVDADYFPDEEYEKCAVCIEDGKWPWLYFRKDADSGAIYMLSAAKDYVDFSHFEYAEFGKSIYPRWMQADKTIYPLYVVFRKKL